MNRIRKVTLTPYQRLEQELRRAEDSEVPQPRNRYRVVDKFAKDRKSRKQPSGMGRGVQPGADPTDDDLSPEILIHENGARSLFDEDDAIPEDEALKIVNGSKIGAGYGLDEAELAEIDPIGGKADSSDTK
jgi:hypothetical protein